MRCERVIARRLARLSWKARQVPPSQQRRCSRPSRRWTVDSLGWAGTSGDHNVQKGTGRVLVAAQPGEIMLVHLGSNPDDGTALDAAVLPAIIDGLRARRYGFVTL